MNPIAPLRAQRIVIAALGLVATIAYGSYACKIAKPVPCNTYLPGDPFSGTFTCTSAPLLPHSMPGSSTVAAPPPTRPWYDSASAGFLNKTYTTVTCVFSSAPGMFFCPIHNAFTVTTLTKTVLEDAISLSGTCPP